MRERYRIVFAWNYRTGTHPDADEDGFLPFDRLLFNVKKKYFSFLDLFVRS